MKILSSKAALQLVIAEIQAHKKSIGFVPTMGALHEGHLALVKTAQKVCDRVVCSIFVNPTQFNNSQDLSSYPQTPERDIALLKEVNCDILFLPESPQEIYPDGVTSMEFDLGNIASVMEGAHRPGHFQGVATVLYHFFNLVQPNRVFMGEKDFQQVAVVRKLIVLMHAPIEVVCVPTQRAASGLALSSRNMRLSAQQQDEAVAIFDAMQYAKSNWQRFSPKSLMQHLIGFFDAIPDAKVEYIAFADADSLEGVLEWSDHQSVRVFVVVWFGDVRLIDNQLLF
ncbi:MAG: pantoate--beta-alanine ligase [Schleiferiaceae bacterium]|nr:pantoate--beta-alanine ligase [Schleiferiaceae bacterium]